MKNFFLLLFFSKTVLLTPELTSIPQQQSIQIPLEGPISAISAGASIQVDVTHIIAPTTEEDSNELRRRAEDALYGLQINATLSNELTEASLEYHSALMVRKGEVRLLLSAEDGVPLNVDFDTLEITSNMQLDNVRVYWKNYSL